MNRTETIEFFKQCQEHENPSEIWNKWANNLISEKITISEKLAFEKSNDSEKYINDWKKRAEVDFSKTNFLAEVPNSNKFNFHNFIFPCGSNFKECIFEKNVDFSGAIFHDAAQFFKANFLQDLDFKTSIFHKFVYFTSINVLSDCDFRNVKFNDNAIFKNSNFKNKVDFSSSIFSKEAYMPSSNFSDGADFTDVAFNGDADFKDSYFGSVSNFTSTSFAGAADFSTGEKKIEFPKNIDFSIATFEKPVRFNGRHFRDEANFSSIVSKRSFSLAECRFDIVPSFLEADFHATPRLDNLRIAVGFIGSLQSILNDDNQIKVSILKKIQNAFENIFVNKKDQFLPSQELLLQENERSEQAAKYRFLRKLAKDAEDHSLELDMFAGELVAERGKALAHSGWWRNPMVWFSKGYQVFSDYGRSFLRPAAWWFSVLVLGALMLLHFDDRIRTPSEQQFCRQSGGEVWSALVISSQKSLLSFGIGRGDALDAQLYCLFGIAEVKVNNSGPTIVGPDLPPVYSVVTILQTVLSAALLFLFFLGVRNRFRIK